MTTTYQTDISTRDADRRTVLELWRRNLPESSEWHYGWLYENGPGELFVMRDDQAEVIGSVGMMRREVFVHGRPMAVGQAVDMNVDQQHRTVGPALQLQRLLIQAAADRNLGFVYGLADRRSQLVLRRAGYRVVGNVGRWVKPLLSGPFLARRLPDGVVRQVAAALVDLAMRVRGRELPHCRPRGARVEVVDRFDGRFDRLWKDVVDRFPVIGCRSAEYLNWRFADAADIRYRTLTLSDCSDRLGAYLVFHCRDVVVHVADCLFTSPSRLAALLPEFFAVARASGAKSIVFEGYVPDSVARVFQRFGFWRRPSHWPLLVHTPKLAATEWAKQGLFDQDHWFLTRADVDTDF